MLKKKDNQMLSCLGIIVSIPVYLFLLLWLKSWCITQLWNWYVVPYFNLSVLMTPAIAYGISLLSTLIIDLSGLGLIIGKIYNKVEAGSKNYAWLDLILTPTYYYGTYLLGDLIHHLFIH